MRVCGIMSGTSLDGIDVAIVDVTGQGWKTKLKLAGAGSLPYSRPVREAILAVSNCMTHTAEISRLNVLLGELYSEAVSKVCKQSGVAMDSLELIGCHGQTIYHEGEPIRYLGKHVASTLQIGDAATLAYRTGARVVSNFRAADMAAGGRGAPLVPYVDYLLFRSSKRGRVALNIGGIANLTAIPAGAAPEQVVAFDTGPGNMVMDSLMRHHSDGRQTYDRDGRFGARGTPRQDLLKELLRDRYYRRKPPKTAGREQYGSEVVSKLLASKAPIEDLIATAAAWTTQTIAVGVQRFAAPLMSVDDLIVSGGGASNPVLMQMLREALPGVHVASSQEFGVDPDSKEAIAFAVLAHETIRGLPSNLPSATGATRPVVLGSVTAASNRKQSHSNRKA